MRKAIVTGATGFIGRFLVRELVAQGVDVIAVVRHSSKNMDVLTGLPVRIVKCNMNEIRELPKLIGDRDIDTVFHIAWEGVSGESARNESVQLQNLHATLDLIDVMHEMQIETIVGAGSIHEAEILVEMEQDSVVNNTRCYYKVCKVAAHWMGKVKAANYGIRFFWPFINTYGEEETSARLINTVIRQIFRGETPKLTSGNQIYDFVHIKDVVRALSLIAEKGVDGTNYVIGSGNPKPLKEFLQEVGEIANKMRDDGQFVPLEFGKITSNVVYLPVEAFDSSSLVKDTGFKVQIPFSEGIQRTATWILGHL